MCGYTSCGGAGALREIARRIRSGQSVAITPDELQGQVQALEARMNAMIEKVDRLVGCGPV